MIACAEETRSPEVCIHHLAQAEAALAFARELGLALHLRSAPGASAYAGVGFLHALEEALGVPLLVDCGDDAGLVMAALRTGCRAVTFSGDARLAAKLADMAGQSGARLVHETGPRDVVALAPEEGPAEIRARLARVAGGGPAC